MKDRDKNSRTPIQDGDSRPDKQDQKSKPTSNPMTGKRQKKFTNERGADIDRADDFRDAK